MTHWSDETCVWNSRMMVGTATFRIVLSSTMMNSELDRMTRAIHRLGSAGPAGAPQAPAAAGAAAGGPDELPSMGVSLMWQAPPAGRVAALEGCGRLGSPARSGHGPGRLTVGRPCDNASVS